MKKRSICLLLALINDVLDMGVRHERIHLKAVRLE